MKKFYNLEARFHEKISFKVLLVLMLDVPVNNFSVVS